MQFCYCNFFIVTLNLLDCEAKKNSQLHPHFCPKNFLYEIVLFLFILRCPSHAMCNFQVIAIYDFETICGLLKILFIIFLKVTF